ncbi:SRPBCC domain-containing protein [Mucilaginibacter calamicampi]|uniref:SRPBCC domain-containing protein n=1 Tax=Mucilaginibacter calamicampi TaxID=1302352 RepID=A0ABW2YUF2_9SPHI
MELKTKIDALDGRNDLTITREFELPVALLFMAYTEPEIIEQWMGTEVLHLENKKHGGFQFETTDPKGNKYRFNGAIHEFIVDEKITRTFEFENMPFDVQLEFLEFEKLTDHTSKLTIHTIYRSVEHRDQVLQMPFKQGLNMAHNRLQEIAAKLK